MQIKLCGFTESQSLQCAVDLGCDFVGFVFVEKSIRYINPGAAAELSRIVTGQTKKVAVVVDSSLKILEKIIKNIEPELVQMHGSESAEDIANFKKNFPQIKVIKAFRVSKKSDLEEVKKYSEVSDFFLIDGSKPGSGEAFDWEILSGFQCKNDWFLSGGLNSENIETAIQKTGAKMIDISSGIEKIRGIKSPELISQLIKKVKNVS
jgi:phosphoribosylanthranilate isomerase